MYRDEWAMIVRAFLGGFSDTLLEWRWGVKKLVLQRVFDCAAFHPEGISEISRWLSVATPPENDSRSAF